MLKASEVYIFLSEIILAFPFLGYGKLFQGEFPTGCLKATHETMGLVASEMRVGKYLEFNVSYFYFHS